MTEFYILGGKNLGAKNSFMVLFINLSLPRFYQPPFVYLLMCNVETNFFSFLAKFHEILISRKLTRKCPNNFGKNNSSFFEKQLIF
jgi:hypothetical protein